MFKQVDVFLKEKQVTQATGTYAYRAYLETLLNYGPEQKIPNSLQLCFTRTLLEKWTLQILQQQVMQATRVLEQDTFSARQVELLKWLDLYLAMYL
jgi:hypothetical protein